MSLQDLKIPDSHQLALNPDNSSQTCESVMTYSRNIAIDAFNLVCPGKKRKQRFTKLFRTLAILITAAAGIVPILLEIFPRNGTPLFSPAWISVAIAIAGVLVLLDRFGGFSTGWPRFIDAMLKIQYAITEFDLDYALIKLECSQDAPTKEQTAALIARCKKLVLLVNTIVMDETRKWGNEFKDVLNKLDQAAQKKAMSVSEKSSKQ